MIFHSILLRSFGLLALSKIGLSQITFVRPPPVGPDSQYANDNVFEVGSIQGIQWTATTSSAVSLVMFQQRPNDTFEYIFQNVSGLTSYTWTVATKKNITESPVFFFEFYIDGETSPTAISHYFNLTEPASVTTTMQTTMATSTRTQIASQTTGSTEPTNSAAADSGLSAGAKAGIGVGIPVAVILGAAAGFFFYRRARRSPNPVQQGQPPAYTDYKLPTEQKSLVEAPPAEHPIVEAPTTGTRPAVAPIELPADHR